MWERKGESVTDNEQIRAFKQMLGVLESCHVLPHVVIIGSWAEYIYRENGILDYSAVLWTQDVDLLIPNIRRPPQTVNLSAALQKCGFKLLQGEDGLVKFNLSGVLELEFLVREIGRGQTMPYKTHLGVTAQGLRNMEIIADNVLETDFDGQAVYVPTPAAYIVHKLVINEQRKPAKREKDMAAVQNVFRACLATESKAFGGELRQIWATLTKKQRRLVSDTLARFPLEGKDMRDFFAGSGIVY